MMFRNYLKVAWRQIARHPGYSLINVLGLAVGLACFLLLMLYVQFELSYDNFHRHGRDVYLAMFDERGENYVEHRAITGAPLAPLLKQQFPAVEFAARLTCFAGQIVGRGERRFSEDRFVFADDSFFQIFTFPLNSGIEESALQKPFSVVLTPQAAEKYFGGEDPLGKVLTYALAGKNFDFTVSGILAPIPANSHLQFDFLASYQSLYRIMPEDYFFTRHWDSPTWTYVKLKSGTRADEMNRLMPAFCEKFVDKRSYQSVNCRLLPLADVYTQAGNVIGVSGDTSLLAILTAIAFFILLIACVNFTNLATTRSEMRAQEIGMRKLAGATRGQLVGQFLGESWVASFLALLLALLLLEIFRPGFAALIGKALPIHFFSDWRSLATVLLCGVLAGFLAGIYPALVLSRFLPRSMQKPGFGKGGGGRLRRILVVGQFVVSIVFIASVLLLSRQMRFLLGKDLGFDKSQVLVLPVRDAAVLRSFDLLKNRWQQYRAVVGVTAASLEPGVGGQNGTNLNARGNADVEIGIIYVDHDFIKTMGIPMLQGRDFSKEIATDAKSALLLNEEALKKLNWQSGVGEAIETFFKEKGGREPFFQATVVGVTRNFNFRDLTTSMQPILIKIDPGRFSCIMIRLAGGAVPAGIDHVRQVWHEFQFNQPFEFSFLDKDIEAVYRRFANFNTIVGYATLWAVLIACLGLFGLASFTAAKRSREIGIRKVLGASEPAIVFMLAKEYLIVVAVANAIAWPVTYILIGRLLQIYPYRIAVGVGAFILSGLLALLIALATVGWQAIRAARANPVDSLRYE